MTEPKPSLGGGVGQPEPTSNPAGFSPMLALQIILGLLVLPLALIYLIWRKTQWPALVKTACTSLIIVTPLFVYWLVHYSASAPSGPAPRAKPAVLDADLKYNSTRVRLISLDTRVWDNCQMVLNHNYVYTIPEPIQPWQEALAEFSKFKKADGSPFSPASDKPLSIVASCHINGTNHITEYQF
jgi:hypothetical protein